LENIIEFGVFAVHFGKIQPLDVKQPVSTSSFFGPREFRSIAKVSAISLMPGRRRQTPPNSFVARVEVQAGAQEQVI
jgi:hypothetical protein